MKLHPSLDSKSSEAVELINLATVMLTQQLVKVAAKRSKGLTVNFSDVRGVCDEVRELRFMCPLDITMDETARRIRPAPAAEVEEHQANEDLEEKERLIHSLFQNKRLEGEALEAPA